MVSIAPPAGYAGYAGFWRRVVAAIIDAIILSVANAIVFAAMGADMMQPGLGLANLIGFLVAILYETLMTASDVQGTVGKMALGIKVADENGQRLSYARSLGRYFAKILSAIILFIGFLMVAFSARKRGLHDIIAGTLALRPAA
jgi:uncharacterized RDD family membrane protein YckC